MDEKSALLEHAERYRRAAQAVKDPEAAALMIDRAREYEERAAKILQPLSAPQRGANVGSASQDDFALRCREDVGMPLDMEAELHSKAEQQLGSSLTPARDERDQDASTHTLVRRDQFKITSKGIIHEPTDAAFFPNPGDSQTGTFRRGQLGNVLPNGNRYSPNEVERLMRELWKEYVTKNPDGVKSGDA